MLNITSSSHVFKNPITSNQDQPNVLLQIIVKITIIQSKHLISFKFNFEVQYWQVSKQTRMAVTNK